MQRRDFLLAATALCLSTTGANALAQDYPTRPIKLVVPYAPGGSADIAARLVADAWGKALNATVFIENKPGAGGNIGVDSVAKAAPDGYTVGLQTVSLAINPALTPHMPYDTLKDLAPVGVVASSQHVLVVGPKVTAPDTKALIAAAKAQPGKLNYGSAGPGSTFHMAAELFKSVAGVDIVHVPYKGGGPALVDTIGGQVDMCFPVLSAAAPHVKAGKLRALGVTGPKRSPLMPDVPTLGESGATGYSFETWFMAFVPAGTPAAVINKLNASLNQTLNSPAVKERMIKEGFDPMPTTPQEAKARLQKEMPVWAKLVKERGITAE